MIGTALHASVSGPVLNCGAESFLVGFEPAPAVISNKVCYKVIRYNNVKVCIQNITWNFPVNDAQRRSSNV